MKTLVEQLREMVEMANKNETCPAAFATPIVGHAVSTREDDIKLFTTIADRIEREYLPLPLDADGVPIKTEDNVFFVGGDSPYKVFGFELEDDEVLVHIGGIGSCDIHANVRPGELTHNQQDTLERIEADAKKMFNDYWGCGDTECLCCPVVVDGKTPYKRYGTDSCAKAQRLDLLRRQREVLERRQA